MVNPSYPGDTPRTSDSGEFPADLDFVMVAQSGGNLVEMGGLHMGCGHTEEEHNAVFRTAADAALNLIADAYGVAEHDRTDRPEHLAAAEALDLNGRVILIRIIASIASPVLDGVKHLAHACARKGWLRPALLLDAVGHDVARPPLGREVVEAVAMSLAPEEVMSLVRAGVAASEAVGMSAADVRSIRTVWHGHR